MSAIPFLTHHQLRDAAELVGIAIAGTALALLLGLRDALLFALGLDGVA